MSGGEHDPGLETQIHRQIQALRSARVLCVGDVMLDRFVYGGVERVSPEAPIPVLRVERESTMLGGAGNVVRNLVALGASVWFVSVVGKDDAGRTLTQLVGQQERVEPHLIVEGDRTTSIKTRYVAGGQQMLRADRESVSPIDTASREKVVTMATAALDEVAVLVLSDYGKGVLGTEVVATLVAEARARSIPVVTDPKSLDFQRYAGSDILTPNRRELATAIRMPTEGDDQVEEAARAVIRAHDIGMVLVTRSERGMSLVGADMAAHLPAQAREVFDVSGAGDTVAATVAAGLAAGLSSREAAVLANHAAGIVVGKIGTAVAHADELADVLRHSPDYAGAGKVATQDRALERVARWRRQGLRVGFTNGCFDLVHPGHVSLLAQARAACDKLVVGLNTDRSVRRLGKGDERPIQDEAARAAVLAALGTVDLVVMFDEDTPLELIREVRPDVLVKGADYTVETVVGAEVVQAYGGRVLLADLLDGHSTTNMVHRLTAAGD